MKSIRLLVADDHDLFREGLRALISTTEDMELVGEAASGEEAIAIAERQQPEVVLMDINMPDLDGIRATRQILRTNPKWSGLIRTFDRRSNYEFL
jgi:DNA-binding NarL/FixJ family response regulator